jgi:DNA-binding beta-propeller fold protein YncE
MTRNRIVVVVAIALAIIAMRAGGWKLAGTTIAQAQQAKAIHAPGTKMPAFQWDMTWPKPLSNDKWAIGMVVGVSVDSRDHVWVVHRVSALVKNDRYTAAAQNPPIAECCIPAPPILEFDPAGNLVSAWGGKGAGYEWPDSEHGVYADAKGFIWTGGNGGPDSHLLRFTREGKFVQQIGHKGKSGGNNDTVNVKRAADMKLDPATNELYVADGYGNRRVIVFDADTGAFKRMWGAYGNKPDDADIGEYDPNAPPAKQFRTVHGVALSKDGLVYVADRSNDRVQVFKKDGTFVKEQFIAKHTKLSGSASGVAFSVDPQQQFLYVLDGANHRVWVLLRDSLQILGYFGRHGHWGGQLDVPHNMASDSKGNLYITETLEGRRVQRFLYKGLVAPYQGTPTLTGSH